MTLLGDDVRSSKVRPRMHPGGFENVIRQVVVQYPDSLIIVVLDMPAPQAKTIQQRLPAIALTEGATAKELLFELA
jgi:hypothetical protein